MADTLTLVALRIGFLIALWVFVFIIVYSLRSDLFGPKVITRPADAGRGTPVKAGSAKSAAAFPVQEARPVVAPAAAVATPKNEPTTNSGELPGVTPAESKPRRIVVTSGARKGTEIPLGQDPISIGRAHDSDLPIRDDYSSSHHARLLLWNSEWMIQDLDSTNGTYLDGKRVTVPTQVPIDTPVRIGATTFELRR